MSWGLRQPQQRPLRPETLAAELRGDEEAPALGGLKEDAKCGVEVLCFVEVS